MMTLRANRFLTCVIKDLSFKVFSKEKVFGSYKIQ